MTDNTPNIRPIEEIYAELANHPDFVVGGYLARHHLEEVGIDPGALEKGYILEGMGSAANDELWSIVREQEAVLRRSQDGTNLSWDF